MLKSLICWLQERYYRFRSRYYYCWRQLDEDVYWITNWANGKGFTEIYGIPRGGLILAVMLSYTMGIPLILDKHKVTKDTLVVDDISDSGNTVLELERQWRFSPVLVTLFHKKDTRRKPDFSRHLARQWVVFPWETEKSSKYDKTVP